MSVGQPKKLVLLFDGTANSAANGRWGDATNVFRLNLALHYLGNQIVIYMPGVGTRGDSLSQATGRGMDEILREAYVNLASNFLAGDEVYLFGFSRGAAVALALADMISKVGLLWGDGLHELGTVWNLYLGREGREKMTTARREELRETRLKSNIRYNENSPTVKFLGLFDPVPGNRWDTLTRFSKTRLEAPVLPRAVSTAISLLAIDDDRNPSFSPVIIRKRDNDAQHLKQIWMPGVHADVGGSSDAIFLGRCALLTMIRQIQKSCPELIWDDGYIDNLGRKLGHETEASISYERPGLFRKFLLKRQRKINNLSPEPNDPSCQYSHQLCRNLLGELVVVRGSRQRYQPSNLPSNLTQLSNEDDDLYQRAAREALSG